MSQQQRPTSIDKNSLKKLITKNVMTATSVIEEKVDEMIDHLDNLKVDDLEDIRERRKREWKQQLKLRDELLAKGHGEYTEMSDQREFFQIPKDSDKVVVHFYRKETPRCDIVDKHLQVLAKKHVETKFCKLLADNSLFLAERLQLWVIPSLIAIIDGRICDYIVGFTELGNCDDFTTDMLEWRLAVTKVINYNGDLTKPPIKGNPSSKTLRKKPKKQSTIRQADDDWADDDEDLSDQ